MFIQDVGFAAKGANIVEIYAGPVGLENVPFCKRVGHTQELVWCPVFDISKGTD